MESSGLDEYLKSIVPGSLSGTLTGAPSGGAICSVQESATCLKVGYAGFWASSSAILGRLYCYKQSGSYYIVYTFDNDSYEASLHEDFVVVASGDSLTSLVRWWRQVPV